MIENRMVILDANILISGFLFQDSNERAILRIQKKNKLTLAVSVPIVDEYVTVLLRLLDEHGEDPDRPIREFSRGMLAAYYVDVPRNLRQKKFVAEDEKDDKYIHCAIASNVGLILSNDKHLLDADGLFDSPNGPIRIMSAKDFAMNELKQHAAVGRRLSGR